jgi:hypothetical protein
VIGTNIGEQEFINASEIVTKLLEKVSFVVTDVFSFLVLSIGKF